MVKVHSSNVNQIHHNGVYGSIVRHCGESKSIYERVFVLYSKIERFISNRVVSLRRGHGRSI
jgi:hypothetical protein